MRSSLSIYQKLVLLLLLLVLIPLIASTFFGLRQARRIMIEQVGESRSYALVLAAERLETLSNRLVSAAFFAIRSRQLQEWVKELDAQNAQPQLSSEERRERQQIFSGIESFLQNLSVNVIGAESYIAIVTPGGAQLTNYEFIATEPQRYLQRTTSEMQSNASPRIVWKGIEPNYIVPGDTAAPEVLTLAMTLSRTGGAWGGLLIMSIPSSVVRQVGRIPGPPGIILLADHEHGGGVPLDEPQPGAADELARAVRAGTEGGRLAVGGDTYYYTSRPVLGDTLSLIYAFDEQTVVQGLRVVRRRQSITAFLISVTAIAVGFIFSRHLAKPLIELTRYAATFEPATPPASTATRNDEIGMLQRAFVELHDRVQTLLKEQHDVEAQKRRAEIEALQAQIQPHFLFNTLNTIRWAAANGNVEKVTSTIIGLASLLKSTINSEEALIPLAQEFEILQRYADIMQLRQGTAVDVTFALDPDVAAVRVPRLVLQPLLENAILHGFRPGDSGFIVVQAQATAGALLVEIRDNGRGIASTPEAEREVRTQSFSRVGIKNVEERLELHYGERATFMLEAQPGGGTIARIRINEISPAGPTPAGTQMSDRSIPAAKHAHERGQREDV